MQPGLEIVSRRGSKVWWATCSGSTCNSTDVDGALDTWFCEETSSGSAFNPLAAGDFDQDGWTDRCQATPSLTQ